jgi:hypothetical protein
MAPNPLLYCPWFLLNLELLFWVEGRMSGAAWLSLKRLAGFIVGWCESLVGLMLLEFLEIESFWTLLDMLLPALMKLALL